MKSIDVLDFYSSIVLNTVRRPQRNTVTIVKYKSVIFHNRQLYFSRSADGPNEALSVLDLSSLNVTDIVTNITEIDSVAVDEAGR